jgi:Flp pilus assembly protein TadB
MTYRTPGPLDRGRESVWRNLLIGEGIVLIVILAIFLTDYSLVVWLAVAIVVVTTPLVVVGLLRARRRRAG